MSFKKNIFATIIIGAFIFCIALPEAHALWKPEIDIPIFNNSGGQAGGTLGRSMDIIDYVNVIYKFFAIVIGILAAAMFMIGAFQYLISAGNNAAVAEAKKTMFSALAGIIIVLTAYLLLRIINKELVDFQLPKVSCVELNIPLSVFFRSNNC